MFDDIPVRAWILIALASIAIAPAAYVYQHIAHSPDRRDITQPPEDLGWRTTSALARNLAIIVALIGLAAFIFTPSAEWLMRSETFLPTIITVFGAWVVSTIPRGLASGRIAPLVGGIQEEYNRTTQPRRFWTSLAWNAVLGCIMLGAMAGMVVALFDRPERKPEMASAYIERGVVYLDAGKWDLAISDFTTAHRLEPDDPWSLANRGLAYAWKSERDLAQRDFDAVSRIDPRNQVLLHGEAVLAIRDDNLEAALDPLTQVLLDHPDDVWARQQRADAYWKLGRREESQDDDDVLYKMEEEARKRAEGQHEASPTPIPSA